ncbi:hypothetical protein MHU86_9462 [Fragilaria crotonensis]|nr:hypothetical protein MHU86_9462 [Fragilaria crotonensis]
MYLFGKRVRHCVQAHLNKRTWQQRIAVAFKVAITIHLQKTKAADFITRRFRHGPQTTKFPTNHRPMHMAALACCGLFLLIIFVPWSTTPSSDNSISPRLQDFMSKQSSILPTSQPTPDPGYKPKLKDDEPKRNPYDRPAEHTEEVEEVREKDKKDDSEDNAHANYDQPDPVDAGVRVQDVGEGKAEDEAHEDTGDEADKETGDEADKETGDEADKETGEETDKETGDETDEETGDNIGDEEGDKAGDEAVVKTGDKVGDEAAEEAGADAEEEAEDKEEAETGGETGDKEGENAGDKMGDEAEGETGDKVEDAEEETGEKVGGATDEETGEKVGDEAEEETGDKVGDEADEETGDKVGDEADEETGDKVGDEADEETGDKVGDEADEETGDKVGDEADEETGDKVGDEADEETGDKVGDEADEETGDKVGDEADEETGDKVGDEADEATGDTLGDEADEETGDKVGDEADEETGDKVGDEADEETGDKVGDEAEEETGDKVGDEAASVDEAGGEIEEGGEGTSAERNYALTVAAEEDADEGDESAMSTDGGNGVLKNSTNSTWVDSNSTMGGDSEDERVDEVNYLGSSADDADAGEVEDEDASATGKKPDKVGIAPAKKPSTRSFANETQHADEEGPDVSDGENTAEPDVEETSGNEIADEGETGGEVGGIPGSDSDPVTFESGAIENQNASVSWSYVTTKMADERDENSPDRDESVISLHERNYIESELPEADSEFSGNVSEALASSGNRTGIVDAADVQSGEVGSLMEDDNITRSSSIDFETMISGQASETTPTDGDIDDVSDVDAEPILDRLANNTVDEGLNTTKTGLKGTKTGGGEIKEYGHSTINKKGFAEPSRSPDQDWYSLNVTSGENELGNSSSFDGSLVEAKMVPKSPDDESGVLEEDSAPGDATVNKTFKVSGSEMNEDEAGVLSNNLMLSDATGLTVDSIEHTPPGNEDVDTTN